MGKEFKCWKCKSSKNSGGKRFHQELTAFLMVMFGFCFCLTLVFPDSAQAQSALMIDTRLMLLAHPLVHDFDPLTRRFQNTPSQPLPDGESGVAELKNEIVKLNAKKSKLLKELSNKSKKATASEISKLEKSYWQERKSLEKKIADIDARVTETTAVPGKPGFTGYSSIIPQAMEISQDMMAAIHELSDANKAAPIIDISSLAPLTPDQLPSYDSQLLRENLHFNFFQKKSPSPGAFPPWVQEAKKYWAVRDFSWVCPVPFGAKDMRSEVARIMETKGKK